jgi:hypothetical protein
VVLHRRQRSTTAAALHGTDVLVQADACSRRLARTASASSESSEGHQRD